MRTYKTTANGQSSSAINVVHSSITIVSATGVDYVKSGDARIPATAHAVYMGALQDKLEIYFSDATSGAIELVAGVGLLQLPSGGTGDVTVQVPQQAAPDVTVNPQIDVQVPQQAAPEVTVQAPSAYDAWLALGNTGTVQDFLTSLVGAQGDKGDKGEGRSMHVGVHVVSSTRSSDGEISISYTDIGFDPTYVFMTLRTVNSTGQNDLHVRYKEDTLTRTGFTAYYHDGTGGSGNWDIQYLIL